MIWDEDQLRGLIENARNPEISSLKRRITLNQLLVVVQQLPGILRSSHQDYGIALNQTWEWFCKNLADFEERPPSLERSLVVWINGYLKWRIQDLYGQDYSLQKKQMSLDISASQGDGDERTFLDCLPDLTPSLSTLDSYIEALQTKERQRQGQWIRDYIERDPGGKLASCYLRKTPHCHCQLLIQRLLLKDPPDRLSTLASDLNVNYQTLNSHWKQKCLPLLRDIGLSSIPTL